MNTIVSHAQTQTYLEMFVHLALLVRPVRMARLDMMDHLAHKDRKASLEGLVQLVLKV
jgi:hypothetical protein